MYIGVITQDGLVTDVIINPNIFPLREKLKSILPEEDMNPREDSIEIYNDKNELIESLYTSDEEDIKAVMDSLGMKE